MNKLNEFQKNIKNDIFRKLPLTYKFIKPLKSSRNEYEQSLIPPLIEIKFYESKSIEPSGFHRPISKIVKLRSNG